MSAIPLSSHSKPIVCLRALVAALVVLAAPCASTRAQIRSGTVEGAVRDASGAVVSGATVRLARSISGDVRETRTDGEGRFVLNNVAFDLYSLAIEGAGFRRVVRAVAVRSNVPVVLDETLDPAGVAESVSIGAEVALVDPTSTSTENRTDERLLDRSVGATGTGVVQRILATLPGWTHENDGLVHPRGVDDGALYVIDGVPLSDRADLTSAAALDAAAIRSLTVFTGGFPAEFGGRSGAVIVVEPRSGIDLPLGGSVAVGAGGFRSGELAATVGGRLGRRVGIFGAGSVARSDRFLDPPHPGNFNNRGGDAHLFGRVDLHPSERDVVIASLSADGTDLHVPNRADQEIAGQRDREKLRGDGLAVSWHRVWSPSTVTNVGLSRRAYEARLFGSAFDTPIFAAQDRRHTRTTLVASATTLLGGHTIKAGGEWQRISIRESFTFAVTDQEAAEDLDVSEGALAFGPANPFLFDDRRVCGQSALYLQDAFTPVRGLTFNLGVRYDRSRLVASDSQVSPRIAGVFAIERTGTAIRGSFDRLYMPPQVENLLLAGSDEARALSPFETDDAGAPILPETVSATELGVAQPLGRFARLDVALWRRSFRNYDDPNVLFGTTIVFPNSVDRGVARGVDVRLDVPERRGWSGYVSYTNAKVVQTGPINGGLFLTDEAIEIGPGTKFVPDHDQRNAGAFGIVFAPSWRGLWAALDGRHASGSPLEVEADELEELRSQPGAELVDFERGRVKPRTVFDAAFGVDLLSSERVTLRIRLGVENLADRRYVYNFGNPFSGTHFGAPRRATVRATLEL